MDRDNSPLVTIDSWLASDEWRLAICGPAGAGKSHLAAIVANELQSGVTQVLPDGHPCDISDHSVFVIDEMERLSEPKALLELLAYVKTRKLRIVIAGRGLPEDWACGLRDLDTRLKAMPRIELSDPDEVLMRAVIQKMFQDRQNRVDVTVIEYAVPRLPRTFAAAWAFVEAADTAGIQEGRPITRSLARNVIDNLFIASATS